MYYLSHRAYFCLRIFHLIYFSEWECQRRNPFHCCHSIRFLVSRLYQTQIGMHKEKWRMHRGYISKPAWVQKNPIWAGQWRQRSSEVAGGFFQLCFVRFLKPHGKYGGFERKGPTAGILCFRRAVLPTELSE